MYIMIGLYNIHIRHLCLKEAFSLTLWYPVLQSDEKLMSTAIPHHKIIWRLLVFSFINLENPDWENVWIWTWKFFAPYDILQQYILHTSSFFLTLPLSKFSYDFFFLIIRLPWRKKLGGSVRIQFSCLRIAMCSVLYIAYTARWISRGVCHTSHCVIRAN